MGKKDGRAGAAGPTQSKDERKGQRKARRKAPRGARPGLLDLATRVVLALFVLSAVAQHTLPGVG